MDVEDLMGARKAGTAPGNNPRLAAQLVLIFATMLAMVTEEEWVVMRKHPRFAFDMLAPIRYLHSALDIPYCHHEKWDGTGYPRSLKGEQIPLAARLFAVVDVYDALSSDRPYRSGWPRDRVLDHIRSLSGTHFEPGLVDAFLKMHAEMDSGDGPR